MRSELSYLPTHNKSSIFRQPSDKALSPSFGNTGELSNISSGASANTGKSMETREEEFLALGSHTGEGIEFTFAHAFAHQQFIIVVGESMRLIAQTLQQF